MLSIFTTVGFLLIHVRSSYGDNPNDLSPTATTTKIMQTASLSYTCCNNCYIWFYDQKPYLQTIASSRQACEAKCGDDIYCTAYQWMPRYSNKCHLYNSAVKRTRNYSDNTEQWVCAKRSDPTTTKEKRSATTMETVSTRATTTTSTATMSISGLCGCEQQHVKFCNYDYGTSGRCEYCPRGGQSECERMGLPMRGVDDCKKWCTAPISDYTANKNSMAGSCGCEEQHERFCNYDYGTSGFCESCPEEGAKGCDRMGLPWRGADDCRTWCATLGDTAPKPSRTTTRASKSNRI